MSRLPIAIGALAFLAVVIGSVALLNDSGPIARSSVAMILIGVNGVALSGLAGLILVRAPWSRWVLAGSVVSATALASIGGGPWFWIVLVVGAVAIVGVSGPWLTLWVRKRPVAEPLGHVPVALLASAGLAPIVVGFSAYQGLAASHWLLVLIAIASAWAYGRGLRLGIWGLRVAVPVSGAAAALQTAFAGNIAVGAGALVITVLAWTPQAKQVTAVITPPLPSPVPRRASDDQSQ
jgi:hypothetical protein